MPNQNQTAWNAMMGKKYQEGGNILDIVKGLENVNKQKAEMTAMAAPPTQLERHGKQKTKQDVMAEMMDPEYQKKIAQFATGSVGGAGKTGGSIWKMIKNIMKKPKKSYFASGDPKFTRAAAKKLDLKGQIKKLEANARKGKPKSFTESMSGTDFTKSTYDAKAFEAAKKRILAGDKVAARAGKPGQTLGRDLDPKDLKKFRDAMGFKQGGQVPQMEAVKRLVEMWKPKTKEGKLYDDQLARAVMANGGEIPEGRRMYGTNPKKKKYPMQTSTAGMPVRGETYAKGGKVKMPKGWHV